MRLGEWLVNTDEDTLAFIVFVIVVVGIIGIVLLLAKPIPPKECSEYADFLMKDIPARCVTYWTGER